MLHVIEFDTLHHWIYDCCCRVAIFIVFVSVDVALCTWNLKMFQESLCFCDRHRSRFGQHKSHS